MDKPLLRFTKLKREKTHIANIRNVVRDIITDPADIKRIIKEYYKELYTQKFDTLDEIDQFSK